MICYYSGTGNSLHTAKSLLMQDEKLVSMAKAMQNECYQYELGEDESVGFVFPVYFYGLPDTVRQFAAKVRFTKDPGYVYALITCGGFIAGAGELLRKALNIPLRAVFSLKMPDNYVLLYDVPTPEEENRVLEAAEPELARIKENIHLRRFTQEAGLAAKAQTAVLYAMYDRSRKTKKFHVDDSCTGCGACAARCPVRAIEMRDGRPVWVKDSCDQCLACLRCNAVQYGKRTVGRRRYAHPDLRKK